MAIIPISLSWSISGWMDGAYMNGAIARFLTLSGKKDRLLIGPWDHGARSNVSPFRAEVEPQFPLLAEILRFFDEHVQQRDTGLRDEARIHYFSFASERWASAETWPPGTASTRSLYLAGPGQLTEHAGAPARLAHKPDFSFGTGRNTRYGRLAALDITDYYNSWGSRSDRLPRFVSEPLQSDMTVSGHPALTITLESDHRDAAIVAYLEDIAPDGTRRYVTEGMLRALHRKETTPPPTYAANWVFHGCELADAAPLRPGETAAVRLALLPTSWCFKAGHRIALALSGADKDNYIRIPYGRPGNWTIHLGGESPSKLELPTE